MMDEDGHRVKRFKHQSYHQSLKTVHLPSAASQAKAEQIFNDDDSHFHQALEHWKQLNLSHGFLSFASKAGPLSASMPLLVHNWKEIVEYWILALRSSDDEGFRPLLDLLQKLAHDLRTTLTPSYSSLLSHLLDLLPRQLSAPSLTALLSTLSYLFKYLLIPSTHLDVLEETWSAVRVILPKCLGEVRRAVAEVWGAVLRRLKTPARDRAVSLLAQHVEGSEDATAWALVYACKSVSQTLHTTSVPILNSLIAFYLECSSPEHIYTLLRRTLTALMHHVRQADHFAVIGDALLHHLTLMDFSMLSTSQSSADALERLRRVLDLVSIPCCVRQGARLTTHQISTLSNTVGLIAQSPAIILRDSLRPAFLTFLTSFLTVSGGNLALWARNARTLEQLWSTFADDNSPHESWVFALRINGALAELGWGGWKALGMPLMLKATGRVAYQYQQDKETLYSEPTKQKRRLLISFLASLRRMKKLPTGETDLVWRTRVENLATHRIEWLMKQDLTTLNDDMTEEINDLMTLSSLFPASLFALLVEIIDHLVSLDRPIVENLGTTSSGAKNLAWLVGVCLKTLAKRDSQDHEIVSFDVGRWIRECVLKWSWSVEVVEGLVAVLQCKSKPPAQQRAGVRSSRIFVEGVTFPPFEELYTSLKHAVLSHERPLRLNALRLLVFCAPPGEDVTGFSPLDVLKRCLQGEEVALDVQGVRERILRIGRVGQGVKDGDHQSADICARWLIAQLKVNLRPLWSPASGALSSLSQRFGDIVWELLFADLQNLAMVAPQDPVSEPLETGSSRPSSPTQPQANEAVDDWEEERSWRDPPAHKLRTIVASWSEHDLGHSKQDLLQTRTNDRFDPQSYYTQILSALAECSSLAERHNRDLVPHFISLVGPTPESPNLSKQRLSGWLDLFSKFTNPKALHSTEILHSLYMSLLSHPERNLQSLALSCILMYKSPSLIGSEELLRSLLDQARWRESLTALDLTELEDAHRSVVVDVMIRLLFGLMLEKRGRSTRGADRRAAVLSVLAGCSDEELGVLVDLMLKPLGLKDAISAAGSHVPLLQFDSSVTDKQKVGFLTLLGDLIKNIGSRLEKHWPLLLTVVVSVIHDAQQRIGASAMELAEDVEPEDGDEEQEQDPGPKLESETSSSKVVRSIRQLGLKRLSDLLRTPVRFDYYAHMQVAFPVIVSPRLPLLDKENTQAPSALLELFYTFTLERQNVMHLVDHDPAVLPRVYDCLIAVNVKPSVVSRIFDIIEALLGFAQDEVVISDRVVKPHITTLLSNLATLVERTKDLATIATPLGQRQIGILSEIAQYSTDPEQASVLLVLFSPLLRKPSRVVPEKVKADLLKIFAGLMSLVPDLNNADNPLYRKTYELLSTLFQQLRSRAARLNLVAAFRKLAEIDLSLADLAVLMSSLNAYSSTRVDEPDFDRRLAACVELNEKGYKTLSSQAWLPVIHNMVSFIHDPDELAVRNNASYAMKHFLDVVAKDGTQENMAVFLRVLFPSLKSGLKSRVELVRSEILNVIAHGVVHCSNVTTLREMQVLLGAGDEEVNFFNNILHVQIHRRSRALRRLAEHCDEGHLRSSTISDIFVPLVSHYIASSVDHHLVTDTILAIGRMGRQLSWGSYYALVQKYIKLSKAKDQSERVYIRTLVALLENFHFPMDNEVAPPDQAEPPADDDEVEEESVPSQAVSKSPSRIADLVHVQLLPTLLHHLETRDVDTDDTNRIPIAIGIVKVALHLPAATQNIQITRLLTILSQMLRSKSQETRDLVRDSLNRIAVVVGPQYLPVLIRELRGALIRGPHLHVLAYVTHGLLVHLTTPDNVNAFQNLDETVVDVAHISAEVIFGESGKDVEAEGFKTKMREVRGSSSRGMDCFAIMAKHITPAKISSLLLPLRAIMHETSSAKVINLVEDVLKRVAGGLNSNQSLQPGELIVLCHTLISQNAQFLKQTPTPTPKKKFHGDAIVQTKRQAEDLTDHYANNSFRFITLGLDLLNVALRRGRFDFRDAEVMSRLDGMTVVVGNALYSTNGAVITVGLRCAAALIKCPLESIPKSMPVFVKQFLDIIKQIGNTESDIAQVALKSLSTALRDGPPVQVKEKDLVFLLELLAPDVEEPTRQSTAFTVLRAIIARKFVVPEIYDLMERISEIMVTNQSPQVQELCRGALLQFLLDYPQGKGRLRTQMTFLAKNLSYVHESGRKSVMELLGAVISKFQENLIMEYADMLFVALVMVVANDDSSKCRELASALIKALFVRLDEDRRKVMMSHLHTWAAQQSQPLLSRVSAQVAGFIVDELQKDVMPYVPGILNDVTAALQRSHETISSLEDHQRDTDSNMDTDVDLDWQQPYQSLTVLFKLFRMDVSLAMDESQQDTWPIVISHLLFPHAWVRISSCRLLGMLFTSVPVSPPRTDLSDKHPLSLAGMREVAKNLCIQLKSPHLDNTLSLQVVKNLFFVGKCFLLLLPADAAAQSSEEESGDEAERSEPKLKTGSDPLPWLFSRLSYQIKSAHILRRNKSTSGNNWALQPLACIRWFAAMASHMEASRLERYLVHILKPVYRITEDDTVRDEQMAELKTLAIELQELVQKKVGTTKFATVYNQIRQAVLATQRDRKTARQIQVVSNPEAAARRKMHRNSIKKESRKRKDRGFADAKGKQKRHRAE
ncbi:hypothetical protein BDN72DRAFT_821164 [Pluteus cervinus]|uniref:Uncharacterized protein n=1 Tax=Pluteus cervinus TaxID=181527 RepID=A0ACD3AU51_9AGAR|nr:hypothetical protein BDN72DRAFT_821164 [Pluteus cervinus]